MKSWGNRDGVHQSVMGQILAAKTGAYPPPELPENLTYWLSQLTLLYGVPVEYMIPDIRLMPTESMRFFYIDANWQDRLVDGALSVGVLSSKEQVFNEAFYEDIYAQIDKMQLQMRAMLRKKAIPDAMNAGSVLTGFLFRSCVVSGWPGLEVEAWAGTAQLDIVRMDRLSDSLLLCLFSGLPDKVIFTEPGEGLHFGIRREVGATDFTIGLRGLGFPTVQAYPPGEQISVGGHYLQANGTILTGAGQEPGVVNIQQLVGNIETAMPAGALENGKITPGGFAIQLVQGAGRQVYDLLSPACIFSSSSKQ